MIRFLSLCIWLAYPVLGAQLVEPERVELTSSNAIIRWVTDVPTGTRAEVSPSSATVSVTSSQTATNHRVEVSGLKPGIRYEVKLGTSRKWLATSSFTSNGQLKSGKKEPSTNSASIRAAKPTQAPPTRKTWGNPATLPDHFHRHGADFQAKDADEYARLAWEFLEQARAEGWPAKVDEDGVLRVFNPRTHAFAAYNRNGTTKTFFKTQSPGYFDRQAGRLVDLKYSK